jgi:hypothetical protein
LITAEGRLGSLSGSEATFPGSALPPALLTAGWSVGAAMGARRAPPSADVAAACATGAEPPAPPPAALSAFDPDPPEQPAAAPTRPETTITAAGTTPNRRIALIETSIVVDGETGAAPVRFPVWKLW